MAYADYTYYTNEFLGNKVPIADFPRLSKRASDFIDTHTFDRLQQPGAIVTNKVRDAMCAVLEVEFNYEQTSQDGDMQKTREKVGEYEVEYSATTNDQGHALTKSEKQYNILKQYLGSTGLLYRGW